ncbi:hypothetical protein CTAYLR_008015 [Chrysophaeum taylorii]|uniref:Cilium assembly protein DZIP1 N-terminal domain-containing protein n=1 Tax=Chrysophaeum taylorii TaxID=2483200 RepID=A0AAD7UAW9_9STRA|nr:hypothetical protein CTAYLR_008015 [Chrysophaeum taylorii]
MSCDESSSIPPLESKYVGHGAPNSLEDQRDCAGDLLASRSFYFAERYKAIDLEVIASVDLERIQREVDIEALQQHLEVLTYGDISKSVTRPLGLTPGDAAFVKIFRLAQLTIEYLLNVQDVLAEGLERSKTKCRSAHERIQRYKFKIKEHDARLHALKAETKAKRAAMRTYESLLANAKRCPSSSRDMHHHSGVHRATREKLRAPPSEPSEPSDEDEEPRVVVERPARQGRAELTLYLSSTTGACTRHVVGFDATAGDLCARLPGDVRLVHRGQELAPDVVLASTGVEHGDTLLVLSCEPSKPVSDGDFLDRRIAELEASIRSEMAVQLQTQLSSLRSTASRETPRCFAGPLEDDDDDYDDDDCGRMPPRNDDETPRAADAREASTTENREEAERRLREQMERLEQRMVALVDKLQQQQPPPMVVKTTSRSVNTLETPPAQPVAPPQRDEEAPPVLEFEDESRPASRPASPKHQEEAAALSWTLRCVLVEFDDDDDEDGVLSEVEVEVEADDAAEDLLEAVASEIDSSVEPERLRFKRRSTGLDLGTIADLRNASDAGDCACEVSRRAKPASEARASELAEIRRCAGEIARSPEARVRAARIEDGVSARQARWRSRGDGLSSLSQAEVAKLEVRVEALASLVEAVDKCPGLDEDMVSRVRRDLSAVCDGLPSSVSRAIARLEAAVEERAELLTELRRPL